MDDLNYHHLRYFWVTAREGSVTRASERLSVAPSTVSTQIRSLEASIGQPLFERRGRSMILTPHGEVMKGYASQIFSLGEELVDAVRGVGSPRHAIRLRVGVSSHLPKLVAYRLLQPVLSDSDQPVHLVCRDAAAERLVADLAVHQLDVVLSDTPVGLASDVHLDCLLLGDCGISFMGTPLLHRRLHLEFPSSLDGAPILLPDRSSAMRRLLEDWFARMGLHPRVVAEFSDSALLKSFGREGVGLFPVPSLVRGDVAQQYGVQALGELQGLRERFYALARPGRFDDGPIGAIVAGAAETLDHDS